jgi:hypothetical protein
MIIKTKYLPKRIANYLLKKRWMWIEIYISMYKKTLASRYRNEPKIKGFQHLIFNGCIALEESRQKETVINKWLKITNRL